ncbi:MAG: hypothetical protein M1830_010328 [Pleopsidium flavum]|nr:MAG: hypothetical protein M1830_010328 [Pleopsidium flavum]
MTSYIYPTLTNTTTTPLLPPLTTSGALSALHNHSLMITLNPLVVSHHVIDRPPQSGTAPTSTSPQITYSITDTLPLPVWPTSITYTASFENTDYGLRTQVHAPMGVEITGQWEVVRESHDLLSSNSEREIAETAWMIRETATVRCNVLLMPYVRATISRSHKELHGRLIERLLKEEQRQGGVRAETGI